MSLPFWIYAGIGASSPDPARRGIGQYWGVLENGYAAFKSKYFNPVRDLGYAGFWMHNPGGMSDSVSPGAEMEPDQFLLCAAHKDPNIARIPADFAAAFNGKDYGNTRVVAYIGGFNKPRIESLAFPDWLTTVSACLKPVQGVEKGLDGAGARRTDVPASPRADWLHQQLNGIVEPWPDYTDTFMHNLRGILAMDYRATQPERFVRGGGENFLLLHPDPSNTDATYRLNACAVFAFYAYKILGCSPLIPYHLLPSPLPSPQQLYDIGATLYKPGVPLP